MRYKLEQPGDPSNEAPAVLRKVEARHTLREAYEIARDALGDRVDEYFSVSYDWDKSMPPWIIERRGFGPVDGHTKIGDLRYRWLAVFPVTGGSEGHYVHVDLIGEKDGQIWTLPLFLGKTFNGLDHAIEMAGILARVLDV